MEPFATRVRGGDSFWGAHFWPGAAVSLLGPKARELRGQHRLAQQVLAEEWIAEFELGLKRQSDQESVVRTLDNAFSRLLAASGPLDDRIMTAVFRLVAAAGNLSLGECAAGIGLSSRQFRRRFRAATELSPKEFARLQRMRSSAVEAVHTDCARWVDIAAEHGYADQAHLVREFRRILGLTSTAFGDHVGRIQHGRILR